MFRNAALGPHHDATPKQFPNTAAGQHHDAAPGQHLGTVPGQHPGAAAERYPSAASSQPRPAPDPPPLRIGPTTSQHCLGGPPRSQKQKIGPNCNFFAIGNCCELPNRESRHKNAGNLLCEGPYFALPGQGRVRNRKKVAEMPRFFVFTMGGLSQQVDFTMGGSPQRVDIAMDGSPQRGKSRRCAYSRRQRGRQHLGPLIGRSGPRALPDWVGRQPVCRGVCCGLDGAAALRF